MGSNRAISEGGTWRVACATALGLILGFGLGTEAQAAPQVASESQPSFSCQSALGIEAVICASPALATLDRKMTMFYRLAAPTELGTGRSGEQQSQRIWLKL